jgi:2-methylisocitrate lyase-like PEP mutase family enzyme
VVGRDEAFARVRAACDARDELGESGPLVMARTDARAGLGKINHDIIIPVLLSGQERASERARPIGHYIN